jgi:hypothetical protein
VPIQMGEMAKRLKGEESREDKGSIILLFCSSSSNDLGQVDRVAVFHDASRFSRIGVDHNGIDLLRRYFELLNDLAHGPAIHVFQHNAFVVVIGGYIFPQRRT